MAELHDVAAGAAARDGHRVAGRRVPQGADRLAGGLAPDLAVVQGHAHEAAIHLIADKTGGDLIKGIAVDGPRFGLASTIRDTLDAELRHRCLRRAAGRAAEDAGKEP